ncbi:hypothetical protein [Streptomyces sp. NPDC056165]|uniref:hypothetical protein n=1 Tax=Streptomyces sp. NPDC056165 TaxID=3345733 RepID=UPI0035DF0773
MPVAEPVPFGRSGEEDVGTAVIGMVNALHPDVCDEDVRHLVICDVASALRAMLLTSVRA